MALSPRATGAMRATLSRDYVHPRWFARVVWILSLSRLGPNGSPPEFCQAYNTLLQRYHDKINYIALRRVLDNLIIIRTAITPLPLCTGTFYRSIGVPYRYI